MVHGIREKPSRIQKHLPQERDNMPRRQLFKDMRMLQHRMRYVEHHLAVVTLLAHDSIQEVDVPLQAGVPWRRCTASDREKNLLQPRPSDSGTLHA
jgi:hypothetical protein